MCVNYAHINIKTTPFDCYKNRWEEILDLSKVIHNFIYSVSIVLVTTLHQ